jgi:hypothetical protein
MFFSFTPYASSCYPDNVIFVARSISLVCVYGCDRDPEDFQDFGTNGLIAYFGIAFSWSATDYWALVDFLKIFSADADNDIFYFFGTLKCLFIWSATDSVSITDFQEFLVLMQIMTFFNSKDHPKSISLVCD